MTKPKTVIVIEGLRVTVKKGGVKVAETDLTKQEIKALVELLCRRFEG